VSENGASRTFVCPADAFAKRLSYTSENENLFNLKRRKENENEKIIFVDFDIDDINDRIVFS
jgi:hypothetical protein